MTFFQLSPAFRWGDTLSEVASLTIDAKAIWPKDPRQQVQIFRSLTVVRGFLP